MHHLAYSVRSSGYEVLDMLAPSSLYNDNAACIQWSHNMTSKKNSAHGVARKLSLWMGTGWDLKRPPRQGPSQPCWHFHHRDAGWGTFLEVAWLFYVLPLEFPSTVTIGHSSLTPDSSTGSYSSGTFGCAPVKDSLHTKFLFCCIAFLSLMLDSLSHFSSVKYWLLPLAMISSCCPTGLNLRSDVIRIWCSFPQHDCIDLSFSCSIFSWMQGWGVLLPRCTCRVDGHVGSQRLSLVH